jgi:nicotinate-nucleotide adenylyltransferase
VNKHPHQRIGLFGGSFDPIHRGHCDIARAALKEAHIERVIFVVAGRPPHKNDGTHAGAADRVAMVRAAIEGEPGMEVSTVELERKGPSYTVDTVGHFAREFPESEIYVIIGLDSLVDFPLWRRPDKILAHARLLVVPRPGVAEASPEQLRGHYDMLPFTETWLSSTEVRERIERGEPLDDLVPAAVADYIREKGMYRGRR